MSAAVPSVSATKTAAKARRIPGALLLELVEPVITPAVHVPPCAKPAASSEVYHPAVPAVAQAIQTAAMVHMDREITSAALARALVGKLWVLVTRTVVQASQTLLATVFVLRVTTWAAIAPQPVAVLLRRVLQTDAMESPTLMGRTGSVQREIISGVPASLLAAPLPDSATKMGVRVFLDPELEIMDSVLQGLTGDAIVLLLVAPTLPAIRMDVLVSMPQMALRGSVPRGLTLDVCATLSADLFLALARKTAVKARMESVLLGIAWVVNVNNLKV